MTQVIYSAFIFSRGYTMRILSLIMLTLLSSIAVAAPGDIITVSRESVPQQCDFNKQIVMKSWYGNSGYYADQFYCVQR